MKIIQSPCEFITVSLLRTIANSVGEEELAVLVASDERFVKESGRRPLKPEEDRLILASHIRDVDYVGRLFSHNLVELMKIEEEETSKQFHVGYVPGTFDMVHQGHIELIDIARQQCDIVVVGVNADALVWENKRKHPKQNEKTRMFIMEHIRGVDAVLLVETNDKMVANKKVEEMTGYKIDAIYYGQDLAGKSINDEGGLDVTSIYTPRSPEKMEKVSSTADARALERLTKRNEELERENQYLKSILEQVED